MKTRKHVHFLCATLIVALLCAMMLGLSGLPASAAVDTTPVAATEITEGNLSGFQGLDESHIGFYAIESVGNLYWYAAEVAGGNNTISAVLTADLTLNDKVLEADGSLVADTSALALWTPIHNLTYSGTLDGNGHVLRGLFTGNVHINVDGPYDENALFGYVGDITIRNLGIEDSYFGAEFQYNAASFVAAAGHGSRIENCYSTATVAGTHYCGGLAGESTGVIENCYFAGKLGMDSYLSAAIVSDYYNEGTLINCYYLDTCGLGSSRATAVTAEQLASGMLTSRLNGGVTDGTQAFYQTVGAGHPTFAGATVYASAPCASQFANDPAALAATEHTVDTENWLYDDGGHWHTCTQCSEHFDEIAHTFNDTGFCATCGYQATFRIERTDGSVVFAGEAFASVENLLLDGDYIKLLYDLSSTVTFSTRSHADITFDINGFICDFNIEVTAGCTVTDSSEEMQGLMCGRIFRYYSGDAVVVKNLRFSEDTGYRLYSSSANTPIVLDGVVFQSAAPIMAYTGVGISIKSAHFAAGFDSDVAIADLLADGAIVVDAEGNPITLTEGQTVIEGEFFVKSYAFSLTDASGTKYYENAAALSQALRSLTGEATITLLCDTNGEQNTISAPGGAAVVLDLAGKKLENTFLSAGKGATLTITDSSPEGTGVFIRVQGITTIDVYGTVIIAGGTVDSGIVVRYEYSLLQITGGKNHDITVYSEEGKIEITGGSFEELCLYLYSGSAVEITGGGFECLDIRNGTLADVIAADHLPVNAEGFVINLDALTLLEHCEVVVHVHDYTQYGYNSTHHWVGCVCGMTEGEAVLEPHTGGSATCTAQAICTTCGQGYGELADHTGGSATCTAQAICTTCGQGYGDLADHTGGSATCTAQAICTVCEQGYGEILSHEYGADGACANCDAVAAFIVEYGDETLYISSFEELGELVYYAEEGGKITLGTDFVNTDGSYLPIYRDWTLDLAGHDFCNLLIGVGGTFTVIDSSPEGTGSVSGLNPEGYAAVIELYGGTLDVTGGIWDSLLIFTITDVLENSRVCVTDVTVGTLILQGYSAEVALSGLEIEQLTIVEITDYGNEIVPNAYCLSDVVVTDILIYYDEQETALAASLGAIGACTGIFDAQGNPLALPDDSFEYTGYVVFRHEEQLSESWSADATHHWHECACGIRREVAEHSFGAADSCEICQTLKPIRVEGDGKTLYFTDLQDAIAAATQMTSAKIVLQANLVFEGEYEPDKGDITLDLTGFTLYIEEFNLYGGIWRVIDSSEGQSGMLYLGEDSDVYRGLLVLESGRFGIELDIEDDNPGDAAVQITGGSFKDLSVDVKYGSTLTVTGGEFEDFCFDAMGGSITITGGEFEYLSIDCYVPSMIAITGGAFADVNLYTNIDDVEDLADVFVSVDCLRYLDADGLDVTFTGLNRYEGGFTVEHDDTHSEQPVRVWNDTEHWLEYSCGTRESTEAHRGGSASCTEQAICEVCDTPYGKTKPHDFDEEWICRDCEIEATVLVKTPDGEQGFADLAYAFEAAQAVERATVTLRGEVELSELVTLTQGNVTLDFAGYTFYLTNNGQIRITGGALTVTDTSEAGTGKIEGYYAFLVNGGDLTVNAGEINASNQIDDGSVTVNGGVFTGQYSFDLYGGTVTVNGGTFKCAYEEFYYEDPDAFTLILRGGSFPEGLLIYNYDNNPVSILDVLTDAACVALQDGEGNPVVLEDGQYQYEGHLEIVHTDSFTVKEGEEGHFEQCLCGRERNHAPHSGGSATCKALAICETCGAAYGALADHVYDNACDGNCNVCLADTRTPAAHSGGNATCTAKALCGTCGTSYGALADHKDENTDGKCDACGTDVQTGNSTESPEHNAGGDGDTENGLPAGAVVAIVIGSVAVAGGGGFSLFWFVIRKRRL